MAFTGSRKSKRTTRGGWVAALDVGTTKVCCFIARGEEAGVLRVLGIGHHGAQGVRSGTVVDMEACATSIGHAVHAAEQRAGETIRRVVVNISGGQPMSHNFAAEVPVAGPVVADGDLRRALAQSRTLQVSPDSHLLHALPVGYILDGTSGIRDPRGMFGEHLGVRLHVITAAAGPVRNLTACVARCHLDIDSLVLSAYASGLACLVGDELEMGSACIDMGGGTTTVSVFFEGSLVFTDCVPVGGIHITNDIARGLNTPLVHAERIKTLYGSALPGPADARDSIDVPQVGEDEQSQPYRATKADLVRIIQPRVEEILELVNERLEKSGFTKQAGRRVVLTGGSSQLPGMRDLAQQVLRRQVRIGRPTRLAGLAEAASGPAFSTVAGLLHVATLDESALPLAMPETGSTGGLFGRIGLWLKEYL